MAAGQPSIGAVVEMLRHELEASRSVTDHLQFLQNLASGEVVAPGLRDHLVAHVGEEERDHQAHLERLVPALEALAARLGAGGEAPRKPEKPEPAAASERSRGVPVEQFQKNVEFPLDEPRFQRVRDACVKEARRTLVGRSLLEVYGPLGAGVETVSFETFAADELARIDLEGGIDAKIATSREEVYRRIPIIYKDFELHWRDVDFSRKHGSPLDVTRAIRAAHFVADREDDLVFNGHEGLGIEGLLGATGRNVLPLGDWSRFGVAFDSVQAATERLLAQNHHRPYACVLSPALYGSLLKAKEGQPFLELDQLQRLCTDGVHQSPAVPANRAVVVSTGPQNFDLAVAQDLEIAFLGPQAMNYQFRVFESVVLRIKRPSAICTLE